MQCQSPVSTVPQKDRQTDKTNKPTLSSPNNLELKLMSTNLTPQLEKVPAPTSNYDTRALGKKVGRGVAFPPALYNVFTLYKDELCM